MPSRILITRAPHQASPLAEALRARGLEAILIPTIELAPPTTFAPLDAAIAKLFSPGENRVPQGFSLGSHSQEEGKGFGNPRLQPWVSPFHWLLFTSANAVEAFASRLPNPYSLIPNPCRVAAIGPATSRAITQLLGTNPTLTPEKAIAESLAEALLPHAQQPDGTSTRFLLIRAETARDILPETLQAAGGEVTIAPAYRTVIPQDSIPLIRTLFHSPETYPDAITFTSSSTVTNLLALLEAAELSLPSHIPRISIGPITSQTLRNLDLPPHAESAEPTINSLVDKIVESVA